MPDTEMLDLKGTETSTGLSTSQFILVDNPAQDVAGSNACAAGRPWAGSGRESGVLRPRSR